MVHKRPNGTDRDQERRSLALTAVHEEEITPQTATALASGPCFARVE